MNFNSEEQSSFNLTQLDNPEENHVKTPIDNDVFEFSENQNTWGILTPKNKNSSDIKLVYRQRDGVRDCYIIGRGKKADIVCSTNTKVSYFHCKIYCDYSHPKTRIILEDMSTNGTFINDSLTRLSKGDRMELKSGDELYLTNPRERDPNCAFIFINMRDRMVNEKRLLPANYSEELNVGQSKFSSALEDKYILGDQIGSGMSGQVYHCLNRFTKEKYAVKVIETKKFSMNSGLTIDVLKEEANMMQQLNHVQINYLLTVFFLIKYIKTIFLLQLMF